MKTKQEIRREIKDKKKRMDLKEISRKSEKIFGQLEELNLWKETDVVFSYVSYNQEVTTKERMTEWLLSGKKLAVPKVVGEEISFFLISSFHDLVEGYQGILEPTTRECADGRDGVILMPGLAFDKHFHRLGYGGGFYDRYLNKFKNAKITNIALAYEYQVYEEIPSEPHDQFVDIIITEQSVYNRNNVEK